MSDAAKKTAPVTGGRLPGRGGKGGMGGGFMGRGGPVEKPKDLKKTFRRLFTYFGVRKIQFGIVALLAVFSTVFGIIGPKLQGKVTTKLFEGFIAKYAAVFMKKPMPALDFVDRKSTRLNSSHIPLSRMPSSA